MLARVMASRLLALLALATLLLWATMLGARFFERARMPAQELPGLRLAERVEAEVAARAGTLRWRNFEHYSLVAPVEPADLARFMARISARPDGRGFVLGAGRTAELHGGAILGLLFAKWRPEGPAARPEDRFPFRPEAIRLGALYEGHRQQIFLPIPGRASEAIAGALPDVPQLARMRFFVETEGLSPVERDSYSFLRLLVAREAEPGARWVNHVEQELSVDLLLRQAWESYLRETGAEAEREDHSRLHLIEVLLAYQRRTAESSEPAPHLDPEVVQRRFLAVELARPIADVDDERLVHYVESLGWLLAHPGLRWDDADTAQVKGWLRELDEVRFADLTAVEGVHLTHLHRGLRMLRSHGDRLRPG